MVIMDIPFLDYALQYAKLGWCIFPCAPRKKTPITAHGVKDATTGGRQIRQWWTEWPNANIAVACGQKSGIYVIDIDVSEKANGWDSLRELSRGKYSFETIRQNTPSGGAHFFLRTDNPPANKNSFLPGIDLRGDGYYVIIAPSIHPNGGSYVWELGMSPWDIQPANYPDFMRPLPALQGVPIHREPILGSLVSDVLRRASAYLATCDPAIQGLGGHGKLLWAAAAMVQGFLLTDSQAINLLIREYNPRCTPPWDLSLQKDDRDFRRKISEARKLVTRNRSGWLLDAEDFQQVNTPSIINADTVRKLISNSQPRIITKVAPIVTDDKEVQFLTQPTGLLGEICSWINATSIRDQPLLTLGCALVFCGVLFGRKVKDESGLRTNLYCMGIGKSSSGKDSAMKKVRAIIENSCVLDLLGGDSFTSDSSIELCLSRNPATIFMLDEIGHLLSNIKGGANQHLNTIVPLLMKLYSTANSVYKGKEYAEEGKQRVLIQPCCGIWGLSTPFRFSEGFSPNELHDGWLSRCLVFQTKTRPAKTRGLVESLPLPEICDKVYAWFTRKIPPLDTGKGDNVYVRHRGSSVIQMPPNQVVITTSREANEVFYGFDRETDERGKTAPQMDSLWSKAEENARKIALVVASGESFNDPQDSELWTTPQITPSIADYACRLIRFLLIDFNDNTLATITASTIDAKKRKLMILIESFGVHGCPLKKLVQGSHWTVKRERDSLISDLLEAEDIGMDSTGRTPIFWTLENYQLLKQQQLK